MLKFEPEAMRAFVKYKPLKKLIAQCVHQETIDNDTIAMESPKITPDSSEVIENDLTAMTR